MIAALVFLMGPLAVLVVAGVIAAMGAPRRVWRSAATLAVVSSAAWLVYAGLYQHERPCDGRATGCPTVYGFDAPLPDGHVAGLLLLLVVFAVPAAWVGWRRLVPPVTAAAALALGPTLLAWWTAPRGDNDGLWVLIFWFLPGLGGLAVVVAVVAERVGIARRESASRDQALTIATRTDRIAALAIDVLVIGGVVIVPLTVLSHAKLEVLAAVLGIAAATVYLGAPLAWKGCTLGQSLVGVSVVDDRTGRPVPIVRALARSLVVVLEVVAVPTLILAIPAFIELMALSSSGRTVTDRAFGTSAVSDGRSEGSIATPSRSNSS